MFYKLFDIFACHEQLYKLLNNNNNNNNISNTTSPRSPSVSLPGQDWTAEIRSIARVSLAFCLRVPDVLVTSLVDLHINLGNVCTLSKNKITPSSVFSPSPKTSI